jgi:hypothetical protein
LEDSLKQARELGHIAISFPTTRRPVQRPIAQDSNKVVKA